MKELNPILQGFKDKGLIDDDILFFIGMRKLSMGLFIQAGAYNAMNPLGRVHAIGLNNGVLRGFYINMANTLTDMVFEFNAKDIKNFIIRKTLFGNIKLTISTDEWVFDYKVTANKNLVPKIKEKIEEIKNSSLLNENNEEDK